jgi:hypothetical protein
MSGVVRRRAYPLSLTCVCVASCQVCACVLLLSSLRGWPSVIGPREARPWSGSSGAYTLYGCGAPGGHTGRSEAWAAVSAACAVSIVSSYCLIVGWLVFLVRRGVWGGAGAEPDRVCTVHAESLRERKVLNCASSAKETSTFRVWTLGFSALTYVHCSHAPIASSSWATSHLPPRMHPPSTPRPQFQTLTLRLSEKMHTSSYEISARRPMSFSG